MPIKRRRALILAQLGRHRTRPIIAGQFGVRPILVVRRAKPTADPFILEVEIMQVEVTYRPYDFLPPQVFPTTVETYTDVTSWSFDDANWVVIERTSAGPSDPSRVVIPRELVKTIKELP